MSFNSELSLLSLVPQDNPNSSSLGLTIGGVTINRFAASGGAADGSTVLSTDVGGATVGVASDAGGGLLLCISASSLNRGLRRKIVAFEENPAGTAKFTCEQWPAQVVAEDEFLAITWPSASVCCDVGAVPTFADADRAVEANGFWSGLYLECVKSALVPETAVRLITDFVNAGGVFTAAAGANATVGDLLQVCGFPLDLDGSPFDCQSEPIKVGQHFGAFEPQPDARGRRTATKSMDMPVAGGGGTYRSLLEYYLSAPLAEQALTGDLTAAAGGSVSSVAFGAGACTDGHMYLTREGDVFVATSGAATPAIPSPYLRTPAQDGGTITELRTFWPARQYARLLSAEEWLGDGLKREIVGIAPEFSFEGKLNDFVHARIALTGSDWYEVHRDEAGELARAWRGKRPANAPVMLAGGRVVYGGVQMALESFAYALNQKPVVKGAVGAPNDNAGFDLSRGTPTGTLVAKARTSGPYGENNLSLLEHHLSENAPYAETAQYGFLIQAGVRAYRPGVLAFWAQKIQVAAVKISKSEGIITLSFDWQVIDHDSDTTGLPPWVLGHR